jgi:hypothetical protein
MNNFLRKYYGLLGNTLADTLVPDFSLFSLATNTKKFLKSALPTTAAKVALSVAPAAYGRLLITTGTNMMQYPGLAAAGADIAETGSFWATTGATAGALISVPLVAVAAFSTTADAYARWECRNVQ